MDFTLSNKAEIADSSRQQEVQKADDNTKQQTEATLACSYHIKKQKNCQPASRVTGPIAVKNTGFSEFSNVSSSASLMSASLLSEENMLSRLEEIVSMNSFSESDSPWIELWWVLTESARMAGEERRRERLVCKWQH